MPEKIKLLFDNNISHRVLARLDGHFRGSSHVMPEPISKIPITDNGSDFVTSRGASTQAMPKHRQGEATKRGGKSAPPTGWPAKGTLTSLKMLDLALAKPCAFRLVIAPFAGHSRVWGFLRWVLKNLDRASDKEVWEFAKKDGFAIVTKDSDFNDLTLLYGAPPKIVWIKTGNCRVDDIVKILLHERETIAAFLDAEGLAILELR